MADEVQAKPSRREMATAKKTVRDLFGDARQHADLPVIIGLPNDEDLGDDERPIAQAGFDHGPRASIAAAFATRAKGEPVFGVEIWMEPRDRIGGVPVFDNRLKPLCEAGDALLAALKKHVEATGGNYDHLSAEITRYEEARKLS